MAETEDSQIFTNKKTIGKNYLTFKKLSITSIPAFTSAIYVTLKTAI